MAITRAQQVRQMYKKGSKKPVVQGGVDNYLGDQPQVVVPRNWQSGPDKPPTELAYITEAEKNLLLKEDIHGSLKNGPNKGPAGIMSLDSFGDIGGAGAAGVDTDPGGGYDTGPGGGGFTGQGPNESNQQFEDRKEKQKENLEKTQKAQEDYFKSEEFKKEKKEAKKKRRERKKLDDARRKSKLQAILNKQKTYNTFKIDPKTGKLVEDSTINLAGYDEEGNPLESNNPFGISNVEYQDLISSLPSGSSLNINPMETDEVNEEIRQKAVNDYLAKNLASTDLSDPLVELMEKNDRFSGVNLEAFQNEFNLPKTGLTGLDIALGFAEPFLKKGSKGNKEFFSGTEKGLKDIFGRPRKSVLEAGRYTIDGMPISPEQFAMLDPALMDDVYKDYMGRRMSGEIDAYGNPINTDLDADPTDPCLGPNPPPYCATRNTDPTTPPPPKQVLTPRILGTLMDPTYFAADGGRVPAMGGGMMDDDPTGGIMDLETGRQMYFLGKLVKKAGRALKKVVKSPFGKAAILGGMAYFGGGGGLPGFLGGKGIGGFSAKTLFSKANPLLFTDDKFNVAKGFGLSALLPFLFPEDQNKFDIEKYYETGKLVPKKSVRGEGTIMEGGDYTNFAEGGDVEPVAKKTMPLLDMDGMEKDYRETGGFVEMGRMERADDVPARLSKNEFVFTADAVRNAGDGDIDKGAEVMYNMMKNLEDGGDVSEESQGLEGARNMFQTSQRLGEVL